MRRNTLHALQCLSDPPLLERCRNKVHVFRHHDRRVQPVHETVIVKNGLEHDVARDIVLETVLHDHRLVYWLHAAVVMPEHVHFIATPLEQWRIAQALQRVKSVSAHRVNRLLNRHGSLWDQETYDRVVRAGENVRRACDYVIENPARRGLGAYRWIWREWVEGDGTGEGAYPPLED